MARKRGRVRVTNRRATRSEINNIRSFTSKGTAAPGTFGTGKLAQLGHFDPSTGRVYKHPRVVADSIAGPHVRVTNPAASGPRARERTASLGMGGVGQVGRVESVGAASEGE